MDLLKYLFEKIRFDNLRARRLFRTVTAAVSHIPMIKSSAKQSNRCGLGLTTIVATRYLLLFQSIVQYTHYLNAGVPLYCNHILLRIFSGTSSST